MKKIISCIIFALCVSFLHAQTTAYFKVGNNGSFEKIEHVSSGGFITIGADSVYKTQIIRWDANYNVLWKFKFTDANITAVQLKIVEANDGSFYFMCASTEHTGSTLITKISGAGALLWQKVYYLASGNMNSIALSKAVSGDNGFLFGGGQCTLYNYVIKCNSSGAIEWQQQYFYPLSTGVITCWSIIPDGTGYVVAAGYNINSLLTFKLSALGALLSHTAYTYTGMQILPLRIVKLNATGGYGMVGYYNNSNDNKTEFVAFFDQALNLLTFNELTVTYTQFTLTEIAAINNGRDVVVDGSIYDGSAFTIAMICMNKAGNIKWKKRAAGNTGGSNTNVEFRGLTTNGNTSVHVGTGYNEGRIMAVIDSNGNGLCNDVTFDITNYHRTLVLQSQTMSVAAANALVADVTYTYNNVNSFNRVIYCGSLSGIEEETATAGLTTIISPNPAANQCMISFAGKDIPQHSLLSMYDMAGNKVYETSVAAQTSSKTIDVSQFPEGLYLIRISSDNAILANEKLVIMR